MAQDDFRLRITFGEDDAHGLLGALGVVDSDSEELADELKRQRLAVTHDDDTVFVYGSSQAQIDGARSLIEAKLTSLKIAPDAIVTEHWLDDEDRWDDEPATESAEEQTIEAGYAPWEVRIACRSHHDARRVADQLEEEGYGVLRRWRYVIAGTATREEADELAARLHGEVEPGGEVVYETLPQNPFAFLGGLGGDGTPL
jgi:hypothetical protein